MRSRPQQLRTWVQGGRHDGTGSGDLGAQLYPAEQFADWGVVDRVVADGDRALEFKDIVSHYWVFATGYPEPEG